VREIREELRKERAVSEELKVEESLEKLQVEEQVREPKDILSQYIEKYCVKVAEDCLKLKPTTQDTVKNLEDAF
jgi:hypothetical protein